MHTLILAPFLPDHLLIAFEHRHGADKTATAAVTWTPGVAGADSPS